MLCAVNVPATSQADDGRALSVPFGMSISPSHTVLNQEIQAAA